MQKLYERNMGYEDKNHFVLQKEMSRTAAYTENYTFGRGYGILERM